MRIAFPMRCAITLCALLVGLSGCTLLPHSEPVTLYQLPAARMTQDSALLPGIAPQTALCLATPQATGLLTGNRIVVVQDSALSTYPGARWNVAMPLLWRDYLLDAFQRDGRIPHLCTEQEAILTDYVLNATLDACHYRHDAQSPQVILRMTLRLVSTKNQRMIASQQFTLHEPVAGQQIDALVGAFGRAGNRLAAAVIPWTVAKIAGHQTHRPSCAALQ